MSFLFVGDMVPCLTPGNQNKLSWQSNHTVCHCYDPVKKCDYGVDNSLASGLRFKCLSLRQTPCYFTTLRLFGL